MYSKLKTESYSPSKVSLFYPSSVHNLKTSKTKKSKTPPKNNNNKAQLCIKFQHNGDNNKQNRLRGA